MDLSSTNESDEQESHSSVATDSAKTAGSVILEFFSVLSDRRRFIAYFILVPTFAAIIFALVAPKWYRGTASVLPAEKSMILPELGGMSSLIGTSSIGQALSGLGGTTELDRYMSILSSDRVMLDVINKFDLMKVYHITSYPVESTIKELLGNTDFVVGDHGDLEINAYDRDPKRAADMANYFVEELNKVNAEMHMQNAKAVREFVEQRYNQNLQDVRATEDSMMNFQETHGVIAVPEQLKASIETVASLVGQLTQAEVQTRCVGKAILSCGPYGGYTHA